MAWKKYTTTDVAVVTNMSYGNGQTSFINKIYLTLLQKSSDKMEDKYICSMWVWKSLRTPFEIHKRGARGGEEYQCDICEKQSKRPEYLAKHKTSMWQVHCPKTILTPKGTKGSFSETRALVFSLNVFYWALNRFWGETMSDFVFTHLSIQPTSSQVVIIFTFVVQSFKYSESGKVELLWWTHISAPATNCCNCSNVYLSLLWHSRAPLNEEGDKSGVIYCQFNSKSKMVSTKLNNLHISSKLPHQLQVQSNTHTHKINITMFHIWIYDTHIPSRASVSSDRSFLRHSVPV